MISLSYDINDHVYFKSKSVSLRSLSKVQANIRINPSDFDISQSDTKLDGF